MDRILFEAKFLAASIGILALASGAFVLAAALCGIRIAI